MLADMMELYPEKTNVLLKDVSVEITFVYSMSLGIFSRSWHNDDAKIRYNRDTTMDTCKSISSPSLLMTGWLICVAQGSVLTRCFFVAASR